MRLWCRLVLVAGLCCVWSAAAGAGTAEQAETLAQQARARAASDPPGALELARRALALSADFVPTEYVQTGRRGEIVEDAFVAAREAYRRHRARLHGVLGECLLAAGQAPAAVRHLRRARLLGAPEPPLVLVQALLSAGRDWQALEAGVQPGAAPGPELKALLAKAADNLGLASLQSEWDRVRTAAARGEVQAEFRYGPIELPQGLRLSTGAALALERDGPWLIYLAEPGCRSCSGDVEALQRAVAGRARVLAASARPAEDHALRQVLGLYGRNWPVINGASLAEALRVQAPQVVLVAREGYSWWFVPPPFEANLPPLLAALSIRDVDEARPRPAWNRRAVPRAATPPAPGLLPEGLAPGEDEPPPARFVDAVAAYRAGRVDEALAHFAALEAAGDGWLLGPEARLNRALCLDRLGRTAQARELLLRTGDSRFQEALDSTLERLGTPGRGRR